MRNANPLSLSVGSESSSSVLVKAAGVAGFALLTGLAAQVAIPLPHTPVPITLQTLVVTLAGITLGPWLGAASMAFYLLLGVCGTYVFAAGSWGFETILGARGGYLLGFLLAQPLLGWLARPTTRPLWGVVAGLVAAKVVIFGCGLIGLQLALGGTLNETLQRGLYPFLPGDVVKTLAALALAYPALRLRATWFSGGR